jgi:hypothetical protein
MRTHANCMRSAARKKKQAGSCFSVSDGTNLFDLFEICVSVFQSSFHRLIYEQFSARFFYKQRILTHANHLS